MSTTGQERTELAELEAEFEAAGGRGVDLAERIDALRLKLYPEQYPELVQATAAEAAEEFPCAGSPPHTPGSTAGCYADDEDGIRVRCDQAVIYPGEEG